MSVTAQPDMMETDSFLYYRSCAVPGLMVCLHFRQNGDPLHLQGAPVRSSRNYLSSCCREPCSCRSGRNRKENRSGVEGKAEKGQSYSIPAGASVAP